MIVKSAYVKRLRSVVMKDVNSKLQVINIVRNTAEIHTVMKRKRKVSVTVI